MELKQPNGCPCKIHQNVTVDRLMELEADRSEGLENPGVCLWCGEDQGGCEPDARGYECEGGCGPYVFGAEELVLCGWYYDDPDC
jgi:hypothetical protein